LSTQQLEKLSEPMRRFELLSHLSKVHKVNESNQRGCGPRCDVGVVIPVYNRESLILGALNSINNQTMLPKYVIVVDDGSTDNTVASVEKWYQENQPDFEFAVRRQSHATASAARNLGMATIPECSLVAFLDSDDHWPIDFLARCAQALQSAPEAIAASVDRCFVNALKQSTKYKETRGLASDPIAWMFRHGAGIASCTLFRKSAIEHAGGWDESLESGEDAQLFVRTALLGDWKYLPGEPTVFSVGHAALSSQEGNLSLRRLDSFRRWATEYESLYALLQGHYPEPKRRKLRPLVAKFWYRSGRVFQANGYTEEARTSFARALKWYPWLLRANFHRFTLPCSVAA
jgi:glycosyltransferase involved in cell wall biosynthesis